MTTNGSPTTATVETLVAEVRVLQVGSRQITLSMYKQLDRVEYWRITPFGRVRTGTADLELVGSDEHGNLVACVIESLQEMLDMLNMPNPDFLANCGNEPGDTYRTEYGEQQMRCSEQLDALQELPLIILAGLK